MKTIYAALASALLISTAFAQTAAPTPSTAATTAAQAGQANLKASTEVQTDASKINGAAKEAGSVTDKATSKATNKASAEVHANKKPAVYIKKTQAHKMSKKEPGTEAAANKTKIDAGNEVSTAPVKADTKTDAVTKTQ
ncbi:hypothetical protein LJR267_010182 [Paraburkholderia hospita]|jgi:hypothetical protein|uniref:hypothetical protein n=1 Tax=Paraburkholderia hospita TaxID=169430 RepID=UPI003ECD9696